jgi:hypothetical protein
MADHPTLEVSAYKAFAGTVRLELRPLTVVFGNNGAGKSALVRLPLQIYPALHTTAGEAPGLPLQARGVRFGSSYLDLRHGRIPDDLSLSVTSPTARLDVDIARDPTTPLHLPGQTIRRWAFASDRGALGPWQWQIDRTATGGWTSRLGGELSPAVVVTRFEALSPVVQQPSAFDARRDHWLAELETPAVLHLLAHRGPDHDGPFPTPPSNTRHVGLRGADTALVLAALRAYDSPAWAEIQAWCERLLSVELRVVDIQAGSTPSNVVEARRAPAGPWLPLSELGTGFAHALPVVVQQAVVKTGENIGFAFGSQHVVEEPEAHLRPAVQADLADLFLEAAEAATSAGWRSRTLVETHSETFLLRLQRRVAERPELAALIRLVYVDDTGSATTATPLVINDLGDIPGFPEGWFDAALHESQAVFEARRARR